MKSLVIYFDKISMHKTFVLKPIRFEDNYSVSRTNLLFFLRVVSVTNIS